MSIEKKGGLDSNRGGEKKLRTTKRDVQSWIKELKSRNITEFMYKDLPEDLKKMGMIKKASALDLIKRKAIIKSVTIWKIT